MTTHDSVTKEALSALVAGALVEAAEEEALARHEAKRLRDKIELDVLSPLLEQAQAGGPSRMAEWWTVRLTLAPVIKFLRAVEAGREDLAEQYMNAIDEVERECGLPAEIALLRREV